MVFGVFYLWWMMLRFFLEFYFWDSYLFDDRFFRFYHGVGFFIIFLFTTFIPINEVHSQFVVVEVSLVTLAIFCDGLKTPYFYQFISTMNQTIPLNLNQYYNND
jgi:hypothetical protein